MIYDALTIITQETEWHKCQIAVYTFNDLHLNGGAEVPTCRLCKLNYSICGNTKPNNSTHVLFFTL